MVRSPYRYVPGVRVAYAALPQDSAFRWSYVEAPPSMIAQMPGLPRSAHAYGVIATNRRLTHPEMNTAQLSPVDASAHNADSTVMQPTLAL